MNDVIQCITERRAIRKYRKEQIREEDLQDILQAGLYAPSAGGRQSVLFVVCQNAEVNERLGGINRSAMFQGWTRPTGFYVSKEQPSIIDDRSITSAFYGAPTVITLFDTRGRYADCDCAVAAENLMLAAHSLGIGSCMVGRAAEAFSEDYGKQLLAHWKISEEYVPVCHVVLGYLDGPHPKGKPRKDGRIIRCD